MHEPNANVNADRVPRSGHLGNVLTLSAFGGASLSGSCTTPCHDQSVPTIDAAGMGIRAASDRFVEYHGVSITCAGLALGHSRALTRAGADARTFTQIRSPTTDAPPPAGCGPAANAAGTRTAIAPTPTAAVPSRRRLVKPTPGLVTSKLPPRAHLLTLRLLLQTPPALRRTHRWLERSARDADIRRGSPCPKIGSHSHSACYRLLLPT